MVSTIAAGERCGGTTVFTPLGALSETLALAPGLLDTEHIDEVLLVCPKHSAVKSVDGCSPLDLGG